ncbi:hypothetical protein OG453_37655 [Streptomyces sp. NBC_01381]|nr:hypothetical protein [Streptomyces sp. NBC_01381]MCX4672330.1 hypothetical protein [Streptomyces sp. NBC_01381]
MKRDRRLILLPQRGKSSSKLVLVCANLEEFCARSVGLPLMR